MMAFLLKVELELRYILRLFIVLKVEQVICLSHLFELLLVFPNLLTHLRVVLADDYKFLILLLVAFFLLFLIILLLSFVSAYAIVICDLILFKLAYLLNV